MHITKAFMVLLISSFFTFAQAESLRVGVDELKNNLADYTILDSRDPSMYRAMHIAGALNFPANWTYEHKNINGKIIAPNRIQITLRNLGIDLNTPVVIYDNGSLVDAARLFWTLEVYGLKNVKVLNAGFDTWTQKDYPISIEKPKVAPSTYIPVVNQERIATKFSTQLATKNPNQIIIDARATAEYLGEKSSAKRFGHIPKAINIPASHNIQMSEADLATLQPVNKLKQVYSDIPKDKKVVVYCAIGKISSANYLALRELGYDVSVYDASWNEWGNDFNLPIETPSKQK